VAFDVFKGNMTRANEWSREDDRRVLAKDRPDSVLAQEIGRTPKAVRVRRNRLRSLNAAS